MLFSERSPGDRRFRGSTRRGGRGAPRGRRWRGRAWGRLIDASAVSMTPVSVSGIVLLLFLQKRRYSGLMAGAVGAALCLVVYRVWAP